MSHSVLPMSKASLTAVLVFALGLISGAITASLSDKHQQTLEANPPAPPHEEHAHEQTHSLEADRLNHGKPGAAVTLLTLGEQALPLNETFHLDLRFAVEVAGGHLHLRLEAEEGLYVLSDIEWDFEIDEVQTVSVPVSLSLAESDPRMLNLFATFTDLNGAVSQRVFSVATQPKSMDLQPLFEKHYPAFKQKTLVSLPAQERIE